MSASATNVDLGNVEYVYLDNTACANLTGAGGLSSFTWVMPYIKPQESPIMFIQVAQAYVDHSAGAGAPTPQHLEYVNIFGQNLYCASGDSTFLASIMERDALAGHWKASPESPMIQVPTTLSQITFTLNNNQTGDALALGANGSLSILLKIVRPKQMDITKNTVASFAQRLP